jgi:M6 family metalloprotease-like protein
MKRLIGFAVAVALMAVLLGPPTASALPGTGISRWVVIECRFQDSDPTPFVSSDHIRDLFGHNRGLEVYFAEVSNSTLQLNYQVQEWKTLPGPIAAYDMNDGTAIFETCTGLHDPEVDYSKFDAVLLFVDARGAAHVGGSTSKYITLDGKTESWPFAAVLKTSRVDQGLLTHEMLHAYALPDGLGQSPDGNEYDDMGNYKAFISLHDPMSVPCGMAIPPNFGSFSGPYGCIPGHMRALYKQRLGWIPDQNVCTYDPARGTQSFRLESSARPLHPDNCYVVRVPIANAPGQHFIAEARMRRGFDTALAKAGVIMTRTWGDWFEPSTAFFVSTLGPSTVDTLGQTKPDMDGTIYEVGERFRNPGFCFDLSVDRHNASREEQSYTVTVHKTC